MEIFSSPKSKRFEVSILIKDHHGKPTGLKKDYSTDNAEELANYWNRNNGIIKNKRRKTSAAAKEDIVKAVKEATNYAEDKQQRRDNIEDIQL